MEKYCRAEQATDYNMAYAHCVLDTKGYRHTLRLCRTLIAFQLQQWLHDLASVLQYTYIACHVLLLTGYYRVCM